MKCIGIDMETTTVFIVGHHNEIVRGALLLVSDVPLTPDGMKTEKSDKFVTENWVNTHLEIGLESLRGLEAYGETIKHFTY
jgi:AMP nucleosidase